MFQAVLFNNLSECFTIGYLFILLICQFRYLAPQLIFETLLVVTCKLIVLQLFGALCPQFLQLSCCLHNLLIKLLQFNAHAHASFYELAHVVVKYGEVQQVRAQLV